MSAAYTNMVVISNIISKESNYNWWGEKIIQYCYWFLSLLFFISFITMIRKANETPTITVYIILGIILVFIKLYVRKKNNIMALELKIAEKIIDRTNINRTFIEQLITETDTSIKNARRVAQWAVGGILSIVIFLGSQLISSVSNVITALLPSDIKTFDVLNSMFFTSNDLVSGSFELISMFTLVIVGALAMVYAILQIHTFSNRRYLRLFKDIEYQLILKDTNI